ncbi:uncharacterized protein LOC135687234 isoform X2 [Rhopilema esculentum]|uniref:uncharacterized protein LOC135687234 isoform X2 n=1 Tax=Rhopilema esculentum TaxID=499914 RepID=UPI0031D32FB7
MANARGTLIVFKNPPIVKVCTFTEYEQESDVCIPSAYKKYPSLQWKGVKVDLDKDSKENSSHTKYECSVSTNSTESAMILDYNPQKSCRLSDIFKSETSDKSEIKGGYFVNKHGKKRKFFEQICDLGSEENEMEHIFHKVLHKDSSTIANNFAQTQEFTEKETSTEEQQYEDGSCDLFDSYTDMYLTQASPTSAQQHPNSAKEQILPDSYYEYSGRSYNVEKLCKQERTGKFNILALVLQVNTEDVVRLKNGEFATFASLFVADKESQYVQLTLWHHLKDWVKNIDAGSILLVTDVVQKMWKNKMSLATTDESKLFNFHQPKEPFPEFCLRDVHGNKARMSIWGNRTMLLSELRKNQGNWMNFSFVAVRSTLSGDSLELHSTSTTKIGFVPGHDKLMASKDAWSQDKTPSIGTLESIDGRVTCLEITDKQGRCGRVSLGTFQRPPTEDSFDAKTEADNILESLANMKYIGCRQCLCELEQSRDGTTQPCKRCLSVSWKYDFSTVETVRPFRLFVETKCDRNVPVTVFPDVFNRLKSSDLITNVFHLSEIAKHGWENRSELIIYCEKIFDE